MNAATDLRIAIHDEPVSVYRRQSLPTALVSEPWPDLEAQDGKYQQAEDQKNEYIRQLLERYQERYNQNTH